MKSIQVTIVGISPLLMHAFPLTPIEAIEKKTPEEQAEIAAYRDPEDKSLYVPAQMLQRALIGGAAYSKGKGRGSLARAAAACLLVSPERLSLGTKAYAIDARAVVVPATKGRIVRYRPRFDSWQLNFSVEHDETLIKGTELRRIIDDTGKRVGILDFRPEKRGPFGRFMVSSWLPEQ